MINHQFQTVTGREDNVSNLFANSGTKGDLVKIKKEHTSTNLWRLPILAFFFATATCISVSIERYISQGICNCIYHLNIWYNTWA